MDLNKGDTMPLPIPTNNLTKIAYVSKIIGGDKFHYHIITSDPYEEVSSIPYDNIVDCICAAYLNIIDLGWPLK